MAGVVRGVPSMSCFPSTIPLSEIKREKRKEKTQEHKDKRQSSAFLWSHWCRQSRSKWRGITESMWEQDAYKRLSRCLNSTFWEHGDLMSSDLISERAVVNCQNRSSFLREQKGLPWQTYLHGIDQGWAGSFLQVCNRIRLNLHGHNSIHAWRVLLVYKHPIIMLDKPLVATKLHFQYNNFSHPHWMKWEWQ